MTSYADRKIMRKAEFKLNSGIKKITCTACNGSGYYDNHGSPRCGCCNGTGKEDSRDRRIVCSVAHAQEVLATA